jgi:hypothetical protein
VPPHCSMHGYAYRHIKHACMNVHRCICLVTGLVLPAGGHWLSTGWPALPGLTPSTPAQKLPLPSLNPPESAQQMRLRRHKAAKHVHCPALSGVSCCQPRCMT